MKTWPRFTHVRRKSCRLQSALLPGRDRLGTRKSPRTRGLKGVGRRDRDKRTVLLVTGLPSKLSLKRVGPNSSPIHQFHSRQQVTLSLARERQGATKSTRETQTAPFLHSNTVPNRRSPSGHSEPRPVHEGPRHCGTRWLDRSPERAAAPRSTPRRKRAQQTQAASARAESAGTPGPPSRSTLSRPEAGRLPPRLREAWAPRSPPVHTPARPRPARPPARRSPTGCLARLYLLS